MASFNPSFLQRRYASAELLENCGPAVIDRRYENGPSRVSCIEN